MRADQLAVRHPRESSDNPRLNAFCRVAPSLRLRLLAIFFVVFCDALLTSIQETSALVQARRFEFLLAMYAPTNLKCFQTKVSVISPQIL